MERQRGETGETGNAELCPSSFHSLQPQRRKSSSLRATSARRLSLPFPPSSLLPAAEFEVERLHDGGVVCESPGDNTRRPEGSSDGVVAAVDGERRRRNRQLHRVASSSTAVSERLFLRFCPSEHQRILDDKPWDEDPFHYQHVVVSTSALVRMSLHAASGGEKEVMGVLQGKAAGGGIFVNSALALPVEGTETRVDAGAEATERIVELMSAAERWEGRGEPLCGWYHSHPSYRCWLSGIDVETQLLHQRHEEPFVALVVDPVTSSFLGALDIGAFRCFPPSFEPEAAEIEEAAEAAARRTAGPVEAAAISPGRAEDHFGFHWKRYYPLAVETFRSALDEQLLLHFRRTNSARCLAAPNPLVAQSAFVESAIIDVSTRCLAAANCVSSGSSRREGDEAVALRRREDGEACAVSPPVSPPLDGPPSLTSPPTAPPSARPDDTSSSSRSSLSSAASTSLVSTTRNPLRTSPAASSNQANAGRRAAKARTDQKRAAGSRHQTLHHRAAAGSEIPNLLDDEIEDDGDDNDDDDVSASSSSPERRAATAEAVLSAAERSSSLLPPLLLRSLALQSAKYFLFGSASLPLRGGGTAVATTTTASSAAVCGHRT